MRRVEKIGALALLGLLLSGCAMARPQAAPAAPPPVELGGETVEPAVTELTAVLTAEEIGRLDELPDLERVELSGSECYPEILAWARAHPDVAVHYTVPLPDGSVADSDAIALDLSALRDGQAEEALTLLGYLPRLEQAVLGDESGLSIPEADKLINGRPDLAFLYTFTMNGTACSSLDTELDLQEMGSEGMKEALRGLPLMHYLQTVKLGADEPEPRLSWEEIARLRQAAPWAAFDYHFTLYDRYFSLEDRSMDLNHIPIRDGGELVRRIVRCMPGLQQLIMDSCDVGNEDMARIRDEFPDTEVIWRVWFGKCYSVRTNVEKILASIPSEGGNLTSEELDVLRYCTRVKYLDLGHNLSITDIGFVSSMPDLEVLILAINTLGDLSPLADCPKLEYLELFFTDVYDLSPLADSQNLRHLNIGMCPYLTDITPLYGLKDLERLYIGNQTPIPPEQVAEIRRLLPDCEINDTDIDTSTGEWRFKELEGEELEEYMQQPYYREGLAPRFALLRDQFGYGTADYSFSWKDPDWWDPSWPRYDS